MKNHIISKIFTNTIFYFSIIFFFIGFNFRDSAVNGWYRQFLPNPTGGNVKDMVFLDSLTGFVLTDSSLLKSTDGGENWSVLINGYYIFQKMHFFNHDSGFVCAGLNKLFKTTNTGLNWSVINLPSNIYPEDIEAFNFDTIWLSSSSHPTGGIFISYNGGLNWIHPYNAGLDNPIQIYMYNAKIGFYEGEQVLYKTTDGGFNWTWLINGEGYYDIKFLDSLTGYRGWVKMKKTTDGGLSWQMQTMPSNIVNGFSKFQMINKDTIWGVGDYVRLPNTPKWVGMVTKTTNGGINWGYQLPDTVINTSGGGYRFISFSNKLNGWILYWNDIYHTKTGGSDSTIYTSVKNDAINIPKQFVLKQNYPNPFNPGTVISYSLMVDGYAKIIIYDMLGKEIVTLVDKNQNEGNYKVKFPVNQNIQMPSGVYFYKLIFEDKKGNLSTDTKKMLYLK